MGPNITHLLDSLGWSLLHSLWQGGVALFVVLLIRLILKNSAPSLRYAAQLSVLVACFVAFLATFGLYINAGPQNNGEIGLQAGLTPLADLTTPITDSVTMILSGEISVLKSNLSEDVASIMPIIGILWCLGFAFMAVRYMGAFMLTQRLRKRGLIDPSAMWINRFRTLVLNAGLQANISLHISRYVSSPVTLGFFKPIVLVPAGFLTGLPQDQVEAILLHEIAHIRRYDYLMNLVQTAIKTVFFFHPAIHYISRKIDVDREQACDDLAVAQGRNPRALAQGLAALRLQTCRHGLALNAVGGEKRKNTPLLDRLTRLAGDTQSPRRSEHMIISALTAILIGSVYIATSTAASAHPKSSDKAYNHADVAKKNYHFKSSRINGRDVVLKISEDGRRWVNVNEVWHDIDKNPAIITQIPMDYPVLPKAPRFDAIQTVGFDEKQFEKMITKDAKLWNQFQIDMEYYQRSLENFARNSDDDSLVEHYEDKADRLADRVEDRFEQRQDKIESLFDRHVKAKVREEQEKYNRLEAHERRQEAIERAQESRERAQEHHNRARVLTNENKMHAKHNKLREKLYAQLLSDGIISSTSRKVTMRYENNTWTANGTAVPSLTENRYCRIFSDTGIKKSKITRVEITPKSTHIISESKDGNSLIVPSAPPVPPKPPAIPVDPRPAAFVAPTISQKVSARYGMKSPLWTLPHQGVDLKARTGTPVYASMDGYVSLISTDTAWGKKIILEHEDEYQTLYGHLNSFNIKRGEYVKAGQIIGTVGSTGRSTGPHLHFEIRKDGKSLNPEPLIF